MYFTIGEKVFTYAPPSLCDIRSLCLCIPVKYDTDTNMPITPIQATTLDWNKVTKMRSNMKREAILDALDILIQDHQPDHHHDIMTHLCHLANKHLFPLLGESNQLVNLLHQEQLITAPLMQIPEEISNSQATTTSLGSTTPHGGRSVPSPPKG